MKMSAPELSRELDAPDTRHEGACCQADRDFRNALLSLQLIDEAPKGMMGS